MYVDRNQPENIVTETNPTDDLVNVPVPRSLLPRVYALLGEAMAPSRGREPHPAETGCDWSPRDFRRIIKDPRRSARTMLPVLDFLAAHPDTAVPMGALAAEAGLTRQQLQGSLGGFTRVCKSLWPDDGGKWPMDFDDRGDGVVYTMDTVKATAWRTARNSQD